MDERYERSEGVFVEKSLALNQARFASGGNQDFTEAIVYTQRDTGERELLLESRVPPVPRYRGTAVSPVNSSEMTGPRIALSDARQGR